MDYPVRCGRSWWETLRGAIGLALALVVYTEHFRYEFTVENGGLAITSRQLPYLFWKNQKRPISQSRNLIGIRLHL